MSNDVLVQFLKEQENAPLAAGHLAGLRHASPEGGNDTVGYGHKLTDREISSGTVHGVRLDRLDSEAADHILRVDVGIHRQQLAKELKKKHNVSLDTLSPRKQAMLLDYQFNLGSAVKKFPSFTGAVIAGDEAKQVDEMTRSFTNAKGEKLPLARNAAFYNTFMSRRAKDFFGE